MGKLCLRFFLAEDLGSLLPRLRILVGKAIAISSLALHGSISPVVLAQEPKLEFQFQNGEEIMIESDRQSTDTMGLIFTAFGNVTITYPKIGIIATSHQAQYFKDEGIVVLSGDVELRKRGKVLFRLRGLFIS